jgi:hypothetical protein
MEKVRVLKLWNPAALSSDILAGRSPQEGRSKRTSGNNRLTSEEEIIILDFFKITDVFFGTNIVV